MLSLCSRRIALMQVKPAQFSRVWSTGSIESASTNKISCIIANLNFQKVNFKESSLVQRVSPIVRFYRSTNSQKKSNGKKESRETVDNLEDLLKDKSIGFFAKFKILFQQYGVVLVVVHCITAAFWLGLFYFSVSRGFDIVPYLEKYKVFDFLERIGIPASEKLKNPGASNALAAYLLYEIAKPIRYPVTVIGTIYAVRLLRRLGHFKPPPKTDVTVRELVEVQKNIVHRRWKSTTSKYKDRYRTSRLHPNRSKLNGHKNGKKRPKT